ncbi:hypothetical protein ACQ4PT_060581 [Festuca glaucescens]
MAVLTMRRPAGVLAAFLAAAFLAAAGFLAAAARDDVYGVMAQFHPPPGILPAGASAYTLSPEHAFTVELPDQCSIDAGGRTVRYDRTVTGHVAAGELTGIGGVHVKVVFVWVPISAVHRDGDKVTFQAGPVSASFPVATFATPPTCK